MRNFILFSLLLLIVGCKKSGSGSSPQPPNIPGKFQYFASSINGNSNNSFTYTNVPPNLVFKISFSEPVKRSSVAGNILLNESSGTAVNFSTDYENKDSSLLVRPTSPLKSFTNYTLTISTSLQSTSNKNLENSLSFNLKTGLDSSDKFPRIADEALLDLVQRQTFKYFWDFGHPVSGLARERNSSGDLVTSGGSGFGIMTIVTAINRQFITRTEDLARLQKIVDFLKNKAQTFHGAFPHWLNGATGAVIPFSAKDNGADLVETSYLMQGLLTARQYFNGGDVAETGLRNDINTIWNGVEWSWFRKNNENVLYWHWSPTASWEINQQVRGWNEALITYVMAASSPTYSITKSVYDNGWAANGGIKNGNTFYGFVLPLGPSLGGPLFFAHYSFLGINPTNLTDAYANYFTQNKNHTLINYNYCKANPKNYFGYSDSVWGLTASDIQSGYTASSPTNDVGVIAPTAALSSFPYTQVESMQALKFFYYKLGDKIWKEYGFVDAFSLHDPWFANSFLAIDQGPIIIMIENYRSSLLWNLFMSCPEVKSGMRNLGFQSPHF
jgi:hypothetical protein